MNVKSSDMQILYLCINLSFSCSLRIGELLALTWDNVFIEDEDFEKDNTRLIIDKQFVIDMIPELFYPFFI